MPSPVSSFRAKAVACHVVIVSGTISDISTTPLSLKHIEDIYFFEMNTNYISSSVLKTSEFS